MAGDWIKMRVDLDEDPAVIAIAESLKMDEDHVVGKLWRVWKWANQQTINGNAPSVTKNWLDRYVRVAGFAQAMVDSGWLEFSDGKETGLIIPNFERHNGKSAKTRALTSKRVTNHRNGASVTDALPEKRREEKRREKEKTVFPAKNPDDGEQPREVFERSPEFLSTEWCFYFTGTQGSERDVVQLTRFFGSLLDAGMSFDAVLAEIRRRGRDTSECTWDIKKRLLPKKQEGKKRAHVLTDYEIAHGTYNPHDEHNPFTYDTHTCKDPSCVCQKRGGN